ncbi:predicted protein [Aspergillus nidulans FGSC A4]|uniref:Uncharacterized protein n=1 Tax=Emericella nidulans (strain FGSC A4 / ATCC 38163 / CBS 112.46 / NRRL 194 / M139) TaxID=227321 RepID=Q5B357_EMENI|nr:hypothetical protein [Aspergillus nidulans FGSC A4]EAA61101.1 predicted protein [Aspergillus nidulans FGSC A4]CBF76259.1 TPA: hypothetical protein ANIA_05023 [Aspergillus nidulans FGSC A4]|eukprot:XP_662627.1 predicted protein [Aspergillus nidulans FGSC A4]
MNSPPTPEKLVHQKSGYMLASTTALSLVPGAKSQPLHRFLKESDRHVPRTKSPIKPGYGRDPRKPPLDADRMPKFEECTYAEMEPGSALFTMGSTYHGAGENKCEVTALWLSPLSLPSSDKAVGGVGYVEDHQIPHEFLHRDYFGAGKFGAASLAAKRIA